MIIGSQTYVGPQPFSPMRPDLFLSIPLVQPSAVKVVCNRIGNWSPPGTIDHNSVPCRAGAYPNRRGPRGTCRHQWSVPNQRGWSMLQKTQHSSGMKSLMVSGIVPAVVAAPRPPRGYFNEPAGAGVSRYSRFKECCSLNDTGKLEISNAPQFPFSRPNALESPRRARASSSSLGPNRGPLMWGSMTRQWDCG